MSADKAKAEKKVPGSRSGAARAGKAAGKGAARKKAAARGRGTPAPAALEELLALLPELDEEGLEFLLEQARIHRYNMEVERLNEAAARDSRRGGGVEGTEPLPGSGGLAREGAEKGLRIERSKDGSTYHIVSSGAWKMFSAEEMAALVRMTREADPEDAIGGRLYAWLLRERRDALSDLGIGKASSPLLVELVRLLKRSFPAPRGAGGAGR